MYRNPIKKHGDFADPFVLRYQGRYYLYCTNPGVRCWSSADLLEWQYRGTVVPEEEFPGLVPFAPEVVYDGGSFYMYTSPHGLGHYVLKSQSPLGPFRRITANIGHSIDFSVFLDEDGRRYAYWADDKGILGCEMPTPDTFGKPVLVGAFLHGWTEGPFVVKRDGVYHLTYTGNHYLSKGYRVNEALSGHPLGPYTDNPRNPLLVQTEGDVVGLGHSSTVLAPDMTSHCIFYHNLNPDQTRDLDMQRILLRRDGAYLLGSVALPATAPAMPDYASDTLEQARWQVGRGRWLADRGCTDGGFSARLTQALPARGAAELNLRCLTDGAWGLRLESGGETLVLRVDAGRRLISLEKNGDTVSCVSPGDGFSPRTFHCVRLEWVAELTIHVDHLLAASLDVPDAPMRLGCWSEGAIQIGYHAVAALRDEPLFPDEAWLPLVDRWRQLARRDGLYTLLLCATGEDEPTISVDGRNVAAVVERGVHHDRMKLRLDKGEHELSLCGAAALAVYPTPECIPLAQCFSDLQSEAKLCVGSLWDDGALEVRLTPRDRREGWEAGVLLRATQLALGGEDNDPVLGRDFMMGYRVCVSQGWLSLYKHRYDAQLLARIPLEDSDGYRFTVEYRLDRICVSDGRAILIDYADRQPILLGRVGIQARGCAIGAVELNALALKG